MQSNQKCNHENEVNCGGFITTTELKMNELDSSRSAQEYHEIMALFEEAFYQDSSNN